MFWNGTKEGTNHPAKLRKRKFKRNQFITKKNMISRDRAAKQVQVNQNWLLPPNYWSFNGFQYTCQL